ncbi:MAG: tetratricopeptide repeat protein, partial [Candidatus Cloacimonetes bacterium]|nr:tetratricopeptide repeat protein [Candidatus Cloacimonadota bacterium]
MKLINICLIVFAVIAAVNAQFDEKEFQLKRAQNYIFQREYTKANEIYQELLEQFPEDHEIAARLITNLIRISELDKAEQILEKYKKIFPDLQFVTTSIVLYTALGDPETAGKIASDYIEKNPGKIAAYREISVAFEKVRNYEKSIEVMLKARKSARDDYLYTRELALAYEMIEDLSNSSKEYLKHLEYNQSYFHFVFSRMKKILAVSPVQIENIRNYTQNSDNESILE